MADSAVDDSAVADSAVADSDFQELPWGIVCCLMTLEFKVLQSLSHSNADKCSLDLIVSVYHVLAFAH